MKNGWHTPERLVMSLPPPLKKVTKDKIGVLVTV